MVSVETDAGMLLVHTDCGQIFAWLSPDKFPNMNQGSGGRSWNSSYRHRWPSHVYPFSELGSAIDGFSIDGLQVNPHMIDPFLISFYLFFFTFSLLWMW